MQPSEACAGLRDRCLALVVAGNVRARGDQAAGASFLDELPRERVEPRLVDVERSYPDPRAKQASHELPADSTGCPGDDGHPAFELHTHL